MASKPCEPRSCDGAVSVSSSSRGGYRCQFCGARSSCRQWKKDACPRCGATYDAMLAQEGDDG